MKDKSGRRNFLKNISVGGTAALIPASILATSPGSDRVHEETGNTKESKLEKNDGNRRLYNSAYTGEFLNRVAFPIGGLGAGMFCIEGTGSISHMSVHNKPDIFNEPGMFAAISVKGIKNGAKLLEGPVPDWKKFGRKDAGNGLGGSTTGLPHFRSASFDAKFPFATINLADTDLPLKVQLTAWSPFIPTDDDNSSLPVGAIEYKFVNSGAKTLDAVFSFNSKNFLKTEGGKNLIRSIQNGFVLSDAGTKEKPLTTDFTIFTTDAATIVDHCWFRGGWWDPLTMAWNTIKNGDAIAVDPVEDNAPGASLYVPFKLLPGKEKVIKLMMSWYTPDSEFTFGKMGERKENCDPNSGCCSSPADIALDKYDKDFDENFLSHGIAAGLKV
jgi:uncharacterized protein (DUF608 family)